MTASQIRNTFLEFMKQKGHVIIPSASLIPENDPTVLFTTAGMHPLVPYLSGQQHPMGKRLADVQKCVRTDDIEEVGDNRHLTFFEMLGNWSFGDYFKRESIAWSYELLTGKEWFSMDPHKLYVTVFEGDADAPLDQESIDIWQAQFEVHGIMADMGTRIFAYPKKKNWWPGPMTKGLCGPDTEIFYDTGKKHDIVFGEQCHPNCDCGRFVEIWNNVFMQFNREKEGGPLTELPSKNVDTGMGLERMAAILQNVPTVFDTSEFKIVLDAISELSGKKYGEFKDVDRSMRIIADHIRSATFIIGDTRGVVPSNIGQGYIVRRLVRRAIRLGRGLGMQGDFMNKLAQNIIGQYGEFYSELEIHQNHILHEIKKEAEKFAKTLSNGEKELQKIITKGEVTGSDAFLLFSSYGFPLELTQEILREHGKNIDEQIFAEEFKKHQELSRTASAGAFKGGLADDSIETTRLHTATHLLHTALKMVLGNHVEQKGSNITNERLRFDFSHPAKMTQNEIQKVQDIVNDVIQRNLLVHFDIMTTEEAKKSGALGYFEDKYASLGGKIKVYSVGDFSKEICGGPHVTRTGELGLFILQKEEAVSAGIRRIKAVLTSEK